MPNGRVAQTDSGVAPTDRPEAYGQCTRAVRGDDGEPAHRPDRDVVGALDGLLHRETRAHEQNFPSWSPMFSGSTPMAMTGPRTAARTTVIAPAVCRAIVPTRGSRSRT
jgi:hypothetical protein